MKNYLLVLVLMLLVSSCGKNRNLPDCIDDSIDLELSSDPIDRVLIQEVEGVTAYWLNSGAQEYDGVEYIVSADCDTLCYLCGNCFLSICDSLYRNDNWEVIWEK